MQPIRGTIVARIALLVSVTCIVTAGIVIIATASHGSRTLDVDSGNPEDSEVFLSTAGSRVTMTARLSSAATDPVNIDWEIESGPNENGDAADRTPPDRSCTIGPPTEAEPRRSDIACSITYRGEEPGTDKWRVWIDHDGNDNVDESDGAEDTHAQERSTDPDDPGDPLENGTGCAPPTPDPREPDCTDVVEVEWGRQDPATLDCDDKTGPDTERETNPSGGSESSETYTCLVQDAFGDPVRTTVYGEVTNGVNDPDTFDSASYRSPDYSCAVASTSGARAGRCDITVTQAEGEAGTAEICFWVEIPTDQADDMCENEATSEGQAADGSDEGNDPADRVEKTWTRAQTGSPTGTSTGSPTGTRSASPTGTSTISPTGSPSPTRTSPSPTRTTSPTRTEEPTETRRVATTLTIDRSRGRFHGSVGSSNRRCQQFRLVTLKKHRPGKNKMIGRDSSNRSGNWRIFKRRARGRYYAVVVRKVFTARDGDRVVCRWDKSPTVRVGRRR